VVLREELPDGWEVVGVETTSGTWEQVGRWLVTTVGCAELSRDQVVRWRLAPARAGTFTHKVTLTADGEAFRIDKHYVEVVTQVEGPDVAVRLEVRRSPPSGELELWVTSTVDTTCQVLYSTDLVTWQSFGTATGFEARVAPLPAASANSPTHYFRAEWPVWPEPTLYR
jgi:hypothetical protein